MKMHQGEAHIGADLVRRLVAEQFPDMRDLPVERVSSMGTVNAIFRLGDALCVRLPRVSRWAANLDREMALLPMLDRLSLAVPRPVAKGAPSQGYPYSWAIYGWIDGEPYADANVRDESQAAADLARFVSDLRGVQPNASAPQTGRAPLADLDDDTRSAILASAHVIDAVAATAAWERALEAPTWDGTRVWVHTDLLRPNLLLRAGRLRAVLDFGDAGMGDPAFDISPAWAVFGPVGRRAFTETLGVDDGTYQRARGYALHQAAMIIPYYETSNPEFVVQAKRTVEQVVADRADE